MRVAVIDPAAAYREGLAGALETGGYSYDSALDRDAVLEEPETMVAIVTARSEQDWSVIEQLAESGAVVVVLLPDLAVDHWSRALISPASGVADWTAPPQVVVAAVDAALHDEIHLPRELGRILAGSRPVAPELTEDEIRFLAALAEGRSVSELARNEFLSVRVMHRRLQALYLRLDVHNRDQAVAAAAKLGLLAPERPDLSSSP